MSQKTPVVPLNWSSVVGRCAGSSDAFIPLTSFTDTSLKCTEMDLRFWRCLETSMNRSSVSPTEWPADYFAHQSSDAFLRATSSKSFHSEGRLLLSTRKLIKHIKGEIITINYVFYSSFVVKQSARKMIAVNSECITMTRRCLLTFKPFR